MTGYMKTIPTSPAIDGDYGVYALDCEMVSLNYSVFRWTQIKMQYIF